MCRACVEEIRGVDRGQTGGRGFIADVACLGRSCGLYS